MSHSKQLPREEAYALRVARYLMARGMTPEAALDLAREYLAQARRVGADRIVCVEGM